MAENSQKSNTNILNEMMAEMIKTMGEEDAKQYAPMIIGTITMQLMKMGEEERNHFTEDAKNPVFMRGAKFGMKMFQAALEAVIDMEEMKVQKESTRVIADFQRKYNL